MSRILFVIVAVLVACSYVSAVKWSGSGSRASGSGSWQGSRSWYRSGSGYGSGYGSYGGSGSGDYRDYRNYRLSNNYKRNRINNGDGVVYATNGGMISDSLRTYLE